MPWNQTPPMDQSAQFIADYLREALNITDAVRFAWHFAQDSP